MATSANFVQAAIDSLKPGATPEAAAGSEDSGVDSSSIHSSDSVVDASESVDESADPQTGSDAAAAAPALKDPTATAPVKAGDAKAPSGAKEKITIQDDKGRRQIEINYEDRATIRKQFELAAGARKWQAERDKASAAEKSLTEKFTSVNRVVEALEKAYAERGEAGVIDLIAGKPNASAEYIQRQIDRSKFLERASPEEKQQLEQKERLEHLERELVKQRTENESREKRMTDERETAEIRSLESTVHPVFEKHRFDGKLGDESDEQMFDEMLWNTALKRLKPYEEQGVQMTRELVDREFRTVAAALRKRIGAQAEKRAAAVVEQKKQEATENVQSATTQAYKKGSVSGEARDLINKGDFRSLLSNWGRYGSSLKR